MEGCLRYCKSTSFQANHNHSFETLSVGSVVCDTAKVRVFKQITTLIRKTAMISRLFAILQKYEFSSKSQLNGGHKFFYSSCLRYCKSTSFQANHNHDSGQIRVNLLFAILQKYEFSSKSQPVELKVLSLRGCLRYCKSTSFQANHNLFSVMALVRPVVCDTAKVRVFKQITTRQTNAVYPLRLFAILQKYEFSSKSQLIPCKAQSIKGCLRYCKSTSFQANHNVDFVLQKYLLLFAILQKYEFSSKSQLLQTLIQVM